MAAQMERYPVIGRAARALVRRRGQAHHFGRKEPTVISQRLADAFGYVRMSSDVQENSPAQQREQITKMAGDRGFRIVEWFIDEGITGDSVAQRPSFSAMLARLKQGTVKTVVCWDLSRFGRFDPFEAGEVIAPLRRASVQLVTVAEGNIDWNEFGGQIVSLVQMAGNHKFLRDLSRNTIRGRLARIETGGFVSSAPRGMCRVFFDQTGKEVARAEYGQKFSKLRGWSCRLAPTEDPTHVFEREAVGWAFTARHTGASLRMIAKGLFERGVRDRNGRPLAPSAIKTMLLNARYAGILAIGTRQKGKYHRITADGCWEPVGPGHKKHETSGRARIEIPAAHQGLISVELFEAVRERLTRPGAPPRGDAKTVFLLRGVLRCGVCGARMWGNVNCDGKRGVRRIYYTCGARADCRRGCGTLRGDLLEEYVLRLLEALVGSNAAKERIRAAVRTQLKLQSENNPGCLSRTLGDIDRRIAAGQRNLFRAKPEEFEAFQGFLEELRQQRTQILEARGKAVSRREASEIEKCALRAVDDIARILRSENRRLVNELIAEVFESITVHRQRIGRRNYLVRGRVIFRSSFGPLAHIRLERSVENLRTVPILRRLEVVRASE
jgi:site-specific DNA recombinase